MALLLPDKECASVGVNRDCFDTVQPPLLRVNRWRCCSPTRSARASACRRLYIYVYTYVYIYMYACMCVYTYIYIGLTLNPSIHSVHLPFLGVNRWRCCSPTRSARASSCHRLYIYVYRYICIYVCMYICVCIHIYRVTP